MANLKVLIVGASIAGPTAAYWLAKAGAKVTVIERFSQLRTGGQGIDIRTAGVAVMRKMPGMEAAVRARTTTEEGISLVRDDGRPYGIIRGTGNPDQQSLVSEYEIFRGDLSRIIFDMTKNNEDVNYVFGEQIASIQQTEKHGGPVKVEFANGTPTSEYDLVVACDGATSRTRAIGFDCGVRDHIKPTNRWAAYFSVERDFLQGRKISLGLSAIGGRFIAAGPDHAPGMNRIALFKLSPRGNDDATLPFREAMKQGDDKLKDFVTQTFKGVGWKADEILKSMIHTDDLYASEVVQVQIPELYKRRVVLVGDAGYAPGFTGTGTSLAIAGAYVLAGEISKHMGDVAAGLRGYEEQMRPMINEMSKVPPLVPTIMAPQTAWGIWLRNTIFAFIAWMNIVGFVSKFFGAAFSNSEEYKLPMYDWEK